MSIESDRIVERARRFDTREALATALADTVAERLQAGLEARGAASLVVSGGSTPVPFFEALRTRDLAWERVTITLADERWVDEGDEASNARLVNEHLLRDAASVARFVGLYNGAVDPFAGEAAASEAVAAVPRPFDAVVLGMGGDGHTASLFPTSAQLERALDDSDPALCRGVHGEKAPRERITLTRRALLDSRWIALHITGDDKWAVFERAAGDGPVTELPVRTILRQSGVPVDVYWAA